MKKKIVRIFVFAVGFLMLTGVGCLFGCNKAVEEKSYSIDWDLDGGVFQAPVKQSFKENEDYSLVEKPTKEGYVFSHWEIDGEEYETINLSEKKQNVTIKAIWEKEKYYIFFNKSKTSDTFTDGYFYYGDALPIATNMTRGYNFAGWSNQNFNAENRTGFYTVPDLGDNNAFVNLYDTWTLKTIYTMKWQNWDGEELYEYEGYLGDTGIYYLGPDPTREKDAQYTYTFAGWDKEVSSILTGNITYTAQYTKEINKYTVIWKDADGTILETDENVDYGSTTTFDSPNPTKAQTVSTVYTFSGWDKDITKGITGDTVYIAQYTESPRKYTITWKDGDNKIIYTDSVAYGTLPAYDTTTYGIPKYERDDGYTYTFTHWKQNNGDDGIINVVDEQIYIAQFNATPKTYTISFKGYDVTDSTKVKTEEITKNATINWPLPVKEGYGFKGWKYLGRTDGENDINYSSEINKLNYELKGYENFYNQKYKYTCDVTFEAVFEKLTTFGTFETKLSKETYTFYKYNINDDYYTISIPSTYSGANGELAVKQIYNQNTGVEKTKLIKAVVPNTIIMSDGAFAYFSNLKEVEYYATTIGSNCFSNCSNLEKIYIDKDSLTTIGNYAFNNCTKLIYTSENNENQYIRVYDIETRENLEDYILYDSNNKTGTISGK